MEGAAMKRRCKLLIGAAILACVSLTALAQSANPDAALLAKATGGDAAAQVAVGESFAAQAAAQHNAAQAGEASKQAETWYRKAAEQGFLAGEMHLAALYRDGGKGFPRQMDQAAAWYRKAAEQGDPSAQATLGLLYSLGQGVAHNDVEAYYWLDLAAAAKGPKQQQYAQNRQLIGSHITADELEELQERVAKWLAAHPRAAAAE
jgi:TPR repeat protein